MSSAIPVSPFLGINTSLPPTQLEKFERGERAGSFMRALDNVDVTDTGTLRTREGWKQKLGGLAVRGLYGLADGTALVADHAKLCRLSFDGSVLSKAELTDKLRPAAHVSYCDSPHGVFVTDGNSLLRYKDAAIHPANTPQPSVLPTVAASSGGSLPAGVYQVVATYLGTDGRESGATPAVQVEAYNPGGNSISIAMPGPLPDGVAQAELYLTECNGTTPYRVGANSVTVAVQAIQGNGCHTRNMRPMPAGQLVRWHGGRLAVANGDSVYLSEPFSYGLFDPVAGYLPFPAEVTLLESTDAGLLVAADKTYLITGDSEAVREVAAYGAAFDSATKAEDGSLYWFSHRGIATLGEGGAVQALHDSKVFTQPAQSAALLVREREGLQQVLAAPKDGGGSSSMASAHTFMDAQVIRQGAIG